KKSLVEKVKSWFEEFGGGGGFNSLNHLAQYALLFSTVPILCLYAVMALWVCSALTPTVRIAQNRDRAVTAGPKPEPQAA
ncbi:hypothetical protein DF186_21340, partial [Enterococcus hirae]